MMCAWGHRTNLSLRHFYELQNLYRSRGIILFSIGKTTTKRCGHDVSSELTFPPSCPLPFRARPTAEFYWDGRTCDPTCISQRKFSPVNKSGLGAARRPFIIINVCAPSGKRPTPRLPTYVQNTHFHLHTAMLIFMCRLAAQVAGWLARSPCAAMENRMQILHRFCNQRQIMAFAVHAPLRWICGGNECA
jgi:hypothetical protein